MKLFSVIVPVYNVESYLHRCIESVLEQKFTDFELILVDDGSPDNCGAICDDYAAKDSRIRVIHKENGGLVSARQAGAEAASGDYICCVDGDDWLSSDYLERFADCIQNDHSEIVCGGMVLSYHDKQIQNTIPFRSGFYCRAKMEEELFPHLIQNKRAGYFTPTLCGKAIKRELYFPIQMTVDPRIKIGEDGACTIPCIYRAQSLSVLSVCSYIYRQNEASMTKNNKAFSWSGPKLIAEHLMHKIDCSQLDFQEQMYRKTAHELFSVVVSQFNRNEPYKVIAEDIRTNLQTPIYREAIDKADFSDIRGKLMVLALKNRMLWLIWLWNRVK